MKGSRMAKHLRSAVIIVLALAAPATVASLPVTPQAGPEPDGPTRRARQVLEELRTWRCDTRQDGPDRRACVDAALATAYPPGFAAWPR